MEKCVTKKFRVVKITDVEAESVVDALRRAFNGSVHPMPDRTVILSEDGHVPTDEEELHIQPPGRKQLGRL